VKVDAYTMEKHSSGKAYPCSEDIPLLCDFIEEHYLPFAQKSKRSWKADQSNLARHVTPHLGSVRLSEISTSQLMDWVHSLELSGLSYSSCFRIFWLLKYVLNCAVRWGALPSNSKFKDANLPARPGRVPELLTPAEALLLIQIIEKYDRWPAASAIHLLLLTGASKAEVLNARWEDLDIERGVLVTNKTFTARPRLIPLNNEALKLIRKLPRYEGVPWLFSSRTGSKLSSIWREWDVIRNELGRPELRLQDLRHTFAGFLVTMGITKKELQNILGHYKPGTLDLVRKEAMSV